MDCYSQQRRSGAGFDSALTRRSSSAAAQRGAARAAKTSLQNDPSARAGLVPATFALIAAGGPPLKRIATACVGPRRAKLGLSRVAVTRRPLPKGASQVLERMDMDPVAEQEEQVRPTQLP